MSKDIFDNFAWHSSVSVDDFMVDSNSFVSSLPNNDKVRKAFVATSNGDDLLIHKTTRSLWRVTDDKSKIEAVFPTDVLTAEQVKELMEGGE